MPESSKPPELLMPVSDDQALKLAEIETQRLIADNLRRLNNHAEKTNEALLGIQVRLTRIESREISEEVATLKTKVDELEADRDRREGAMHFGNWLVRNWPFLAGMMMLAVIVLQATGKLKI